MKLSEGLLKFWEQFGKESAIKQLYYFNNKLISTIRSPKEEKVISKFYTGQGSEYILTKDGYARRIKSPHNNTGGIDSGLHDWNNGNTIFTFGDKGEQFNLAIEKIQDKYPHLRPVISNNKIAIQLFDPKLNKWRLANISDAYPRSVKGEFKSMGMEY